ncbi:MAG: N-acetylmuramoyl-L-alanine amidase [Bacillota bacterium]|nr:N-acetylmuramoyl-L-alanine amidase [Bacillota bacterium]
MRSRFALLSLIAIMLLPQICSAAALNGYGDRGTAVRDAQQALVRSGFNPGPVDGVFGPRTLAAVKAFQKGRGLAVDGVVGPATLAALGTVTLAARSARAPLAGKTIVIDPGHGGYNPGALGVDGSREEDNVLAIGLHLRDLLTNAGAQVLMTRSTDVEPSLAQRVSLANTNKAALYVSVHNNSYKDPAASGVMTFSRYGDARSQKVSTVIMEELKKWTGMTNKGVEQGNYYVLRNTSMPAVIAEIGFMTNWSDVRILKTAVFRRSAAEGLYYGILRFLTQG